MLGVGSTRGLTKGLCNARLERLRQLATSGLRIMVLAWDSGCALSSHTRK